MHRRFRSYIILRRDCNEDGWTERGEDDDDAARRRQEHARRQARDNRRRGGVYSEGVRQKTRYRAISGGVRV